MKYCVFCMRPMDINAHNCPHCGKVQSYSAPEYHLMPGTVIGGKIMLGAALGEGGFGITYIGRDINLDIRVAVKEYFPNGYANRSSAMSASVSISSSQERQEFYDKGKHRFVEEARTLAQFSEEPGVVGVRDYFECNNTAYIVMEFLDGITLKEYLKRNGKLSPGETVRVLTPVMESLEKVHTKNLIHRDISPDNIMMLFDGRVKLLDFGAARSVSAEANKSLSVVLKPGYAPEEQYRSKGNQGPWTDVYAMSATMYKCITGITPDDSVERLSQDELKPPSRLGIPIGRELEKALLKGLAVRQHERYQNMRQLLDGLKGIGGGSTSFGDGGRTVPVNGGPNGGNGGGVRPEDVWKKAVILNKGGRVSNVPSGTAHQNGGNVAGINGGRVYVVPPKKKSNALMVIFFLLSFIFAILAPAALLMYGYDLSTMIIGVAALSLVTLVPFIVSSVRGVKRRGVRKATVTVLCLLLVLVISAVTVVMTVAMPILRFVGKWNGFDTSDMTMGELTVYANGVWNLSANGEEYSGYCSAADDTITFYDAYNNYVCEGGSDQDKLYIYYDIEKSEEDIYYTLQTQSEEEAFFDMLNLFALRDYFRRA